MNNGVKQWIFQRVSNALIISFGICLLCIFLSEDGLSYTSINELLSGGAFSIYLAIVLVFSCLNAMLAGWQIDGDYASKFGLPKNLITTVAVIASLGLLVFGLLVLF